MRRAILPLLVLLLLPAQARAQPAYGAGNVNDATGKPVAARTTQAADSPEIAAWTTLLTAFVAPGALGMPALALGVLGWDGTNVRLLSVSATGILGVDTELPAAAALTDADPNPTVPGVASYLMGWVPGGPVWERIRSSGAGDLNVNLRLLGGAQIPQGLADVSASTLTVTEAGSPSGACTAVNLAAANTAILAARAGRKWFLVEVTDIDGNAEVNVGATSANGVILKASPIANDPGGSWVWPASGAVVGGPVTGGTTITVRACEAY